MTYTNQEMIFFNSLLDGKQIFGLRVESPLRIDKKYIEGTISSLQEKGWIGEDKKLVQTKENPALLLDLYKKATSHIAINHMRIALHGTKFVVLILRNEENYEIYGMSRVALFTLLIEGTPLLRENAISWETDSNKARFSSEEFKQLIKDKKTYEASIFQKYQDKKLIEDYMLFRNEKTAELFCGKEKTRQIVNGQSIRLLLMSLLEIDLESMEE